MEGCLKVTNFGYFWIKIPPDSLRKAKNKTKTYNFCRKPEYSVDDGRKADFVTRGMILWSKAGEYKAYAESRFAFITLVKHE